MSDSVESLIAYCRENHRICPQPWPWNQLYEMLPNRKRVGGGWKPAVSRILGAWHHYPGLLKMLRLAEHIEWAAEHGVLESVSSFLRGLPEKDWFPGRD